MTNTEKKLTIALLKMASEHFSRHGCNDFPKEIESLLSPSEWDKLNKEYHEYNGDPEEYVPNQVLSHDWLWMNYMAHKLEKGLDVKLSMRF